jgi:hypothetical protein
MRGTLLSIILMIVAAGMMGCTDSIIPCTDDVDCEMDWGWGGENDAASWGEMTCSGPHPLEACEDMLSYLDWLPDWLPILDWIVLPDCTELYGGMDPATGTCESSWGGGWF